MRISGQLPVADAAQLSAVLDALMPSAASYATDGEGVPDLDARRADALLLLTQLATQAEQAPQHAGARPHAHITIPYEFLTKALGRAVLTDHLGASISASRSRSMAC